MRYLSVATLLVGIFPAIGIFGCSDSSLQHKVNDQEKAIQQLKTDVESLKADVSTAKLQQEISEIAYLTPGERGYSILKTAMGAVTVSLDDVQAYANGSKVRLRFGNLTSASMTGAKAKVEWGSVDAKGSPINEEAKTKDFDLVKQLPPGTWTDVDVILDGVPPTNLGFVRVREFSSASISLRR